MSSSLHRALAALALIGLVLVGLTVALSLTSDHIEDRGLNAAIVSLLMSTYIGVGLYAWWRRPQNRFGAIMTAVGFLAFSAALCASNSALIFCIGIASSSLYLVAAIHMLLAFPTGRIPTRAQRWLIGSAYVVAVVAPLTMMMFDRDGSFDEPIPGNAFFVADAPGLLSVLDIAGPLIGVAIIKAISIILVQRWRRAAPHERPALSPLLWTGSTMIGLLATLLTVELVASDSRIADVVTWGALAMFAALPFAFLAGLRRSRVWRAGAVADLVASLGGAPARWKLRDAVADALGDPTLQVAYALDDGGYVDELGHELTLPDEDDPERAATEVRRERRRVGALIHDRALREQPELVRTVATAASLALENQRLNAELRARVEELQRSRKRLIEAGMAERRRLERDLHDGAQQRLVSLSLQLGLVAQQLDRGDAGVRAARELLEGARTEARSALEDLRELARGIHPAVLTDRGLGPALEALAERAPLPVDVGAVPDERLPGPVEAAAYFVVAESLTNVVKYAEATRAEVRVRREHGWALVEVRDDGVGGADPAAGTGLRGLADRLAAMDGRLEIESEPHRGTTIRARVPLAADREPAEARA